MVTAARLSRNFWLADRDIVEFKLELKLDLQMLSELGCSAGRCVVGRGAQSFILKGSMKKEELWQSTCQRRKTAIIKNRDEMNTHTAEAEKRVLRFWEFTIFGADLSPLSPADCDSLISGTVPVIEVIFLYTLQKDKVSVREGLKKVHPHLKVDFSILNVFVTVTQKTLRS